MCVEVHSRVVPLDQQYFIRLKSEDTLLTFCCELVLAPMADVLVSRVVEPATPVVPTGCCTATVGIF